MIDPPTAAILAAVGSSGATLALLGCLRIAHAIQERRRRRRLQWVRAALVKLQQGMEAR